MSEKQVWEKLGAKNPYYGVFTAERMRKENLDSENLNEFFSSGVAYVDKVWEQIENHFKPNFKPKQALDFGCGVGRLVLPLAEKCGSVLGIDISDNMLAEARKNASNENVSNVKFENSQKILFEMKEEFDFVHSFIVFQHIRPNRGEVIFEKILKMLKTGGIGVLHVTFQEYLKPKNKITNTLYRNFPFIHKLRNFVLRAGDEPYISMHSYNLNNIFKVLQENDCHNCFVRFTFHGYVGILIFFQKNKDLFDPDFR